MAVQRERAHRPHHTTLSINTEPHHAPNQTVIDASSPTPTLIRVTREPLPKPDSLIETAWTHVFSLNGGVFIQPGRGAGMMMDGRGHDPREWVVAHSCRAAIGESGDGVGSVG